MMLRAAPSALLRLLAGTTLVAAALVGCKPQPAPAPAPAPGAPAAPAVKLVSKEQAMATLMVLPEIQNWSIEIAQRSRGKAQGAIIEDNPQPRSINGRAYWQLSFVENHAASVHRRASFLVAQTDATILVDDTDSDSVLTLDEWRRGIRRVELKAAP